MAQTVHLDPRLTEIVKEAQKGYSIDVLGVIERAVIMGKKYIEIFPGQNKHFSDLLYPCLKKISSMLVNDSDPNYQAKAVKFDELADKVKIERLYALKQDSLELFVKEEDLETFRAEMKKNTSLSNHRL